jgi:V/A-type H+-transporting ATPase subunit K
MDVGTGLALVGAGLAIGIAGLGTGVAQGQVGAAAVGATAEDPKMFGKGIVMMVLPETIVILGFVVAFLLMNK